MVRVGKFSPDSGQEPRPFQTQTNMPKLLCSDTLYTQAIHNIFLYPLYETLPLSSKGDCAADYPISWYRFVLLIKRNKAMLVRMELQGGRQAAEPRCR